MYKNYHYHYYYYYYHHHHYYMRGTHKDDEGCVGYTALRHVAAGMLGNKQTKKLSAADSTTKRTFLMITRVTNIREHVTAATCALHRLSHRLRHEGCTLVSLLIR